MAQGGFITFEGGEGAGKSTQARKLSERLNRFGIPTLLTREPGGTPLAEAIRAILLDPAIGQRTELAELLLFYAARADHLNQVIRPALADGTWVICDRFIDSTRAYQGWDDPLKRVVIQRLESVVVSDCMPHLTIILDLDPEIGMRRAVRRTYGALNSQSKLMQPEQIPFSFAPDRFEALDLNFHKNVRQTFKSIAEAEPERCVLIDGSQNVQTVAHEIMKAVFGRFESSHSEIAEAKRA